MKKVIKTAFMLTSISLLSSPSWADRDAISELLNSQQTEVSFSVSYSERTPSKRPAFLSVEEDDLERFVSAPSRTRAYDSISGLLDAEGIFDTGDMRQSIVTAAFNHLNIPYKYGGQSLSTGFDCSGLVMTIFQQVANKRLPRTTASQAAVTTSIKRSELRPGDLVFFNTTGKRRFSHVGIYVGDDQFIHAPSSGSQVRIDNINSNYWNKRFTGARRVIS